MTEEQAEKLKEMIAETIRYCLRDDVWYLIDYPGQSKNLCKIKRLEETTWGQELENAVVDRMVLSIMYDLLLELNGTFSFSFTDADGTEHTHTHKVKEV